MNKEELYNEICFVLTDYKNSKNVSKDLVINAFYNVLVDVQKYFDFENKDKTQINKHEFFYDVLKTYENFLNNNDVSMFSSSLNETLIQYRIDNNLE